MIDALAPSSPEYDGDAPRLRRIPGDRRRRRGAAEQIASALWPEDRRWRNSGRGSSWSISSGFAGCLATCRGTGSLSTRRSRGFSCFRDDRPVFTTRVVVGETDKQTPEFQSTIDSVLFNPPWNIPRSIAQTEICRNWRPIPDYLASHHMRFRSNGSVQQEAGPYSALGRLKFEMNDRYDVYLHDTPTKSLFHSAARMMSHGCVRVENPRDLAVLLLGQTPQAIEKGIASGHTGRRALPESMPIFIVYQTAYVESDGSIQFRADPYDRDDEILHYLTRAQQLPVAQEAAAAQRKG